MVHFFLVIFSDTILMLGLFNVGMKVLAWYLDLYCIEKTFKYLIAIGFFFFFFGCKNLILYTKMVSEIGDNSSASVSTSVRLIYS